MTEILKEGFDATVNDAVLRGWSSGWTSSTTGRFGRGLCANIQDSVRTIELGANYATLCASVGYQSTGSPNSRVILQLMDAGTIQVDVRVDGSGFFQVTRNGTVLATSTKHITSGVWYHVSLAATINNTTGTYDLWIDGINVLTATGVNTRASANNYANRFGLANGVAHLIDDVYITDQLTFPGDIEVWASHPNGNGNSSQLLGSDGNSTDNYLLVDEVSENGDTDYVSSSTTGQQDTYAMGNLPSVPTSILSVSACAYLRKDDAGARTARTVLRSGGTDYEGTDYTLSSSYTLTQTNYTTDPATSAAWTETNVNAVEMGTKVQA